MEYKKGKVVYSIINTAGGLLNIRKFDPENNPIWNSFKEKRYWFDESFEKVNAQNMLIILKGENCNVVKITILDTTGSNKDSTLPPPEPIRENPIVCVPKNILIRTDSLLSLLCHRHKKYLEDIGEWEEAKEIYELCREFQK